MYASIVDLIQIILWNALFVIWQWLVLITFVFICWGVLFLIKWKWI